jgi:Sulfatase
MLGVLLDLEPPKRPDIPRAPLRMIRAIEANDRRHPIAWPARALRRFLALHLCESCRYRTGCGAQTSSAVRLIRQARFPSIALSPRTSRWSATHCVPWTWKILLGHHELIAHQSLKTSSVMGETMSQFDPICLADCPRGGLARAVLLPWCSGRDCETEARRPSGSSQDAPECSDILDGCYGGGIAVGAPTPNFDKLAQSGLRLTSCYSEPSCSPSRATLMTGRVPNRHGLHRPPVYGEPGGSKAKSPSRNSCPTQVT